MERLRCLSQPFFKKEETMGYSGIGGQAVMEGVMMKNGIHYAVAVRKPDKEIVVDAREYPGIVKNQKIKKQKMNLKKL